MQANKTNKQNKTSKQTNSKQITIASKGLSVRDLLSSYVFAGVIKQEEVDGCEKAEDSFHTPINKNISKQIQYQDFILKMKHVFAVKFKRILGNTNNMVKGKSAVKDFQSYIRHYKIACEFHACGILEV